MISVDISKIIQEQIASEVQIGSTATDRVQLYCPFSFDDGDSYTFIFVRDSGGKWTLTDDGEVVSHVSYSGVELLSPERRPRLDKALEFYGLQEAAGALKLEIEGDNFGEAFYRFSQACFEISRIGKFPREKTKAPNKRMSHLAKIIESPGVAPGFTKDWHHPKYDAQNVYDVDYFVPKGSGKSNVLIFACDTTYECYKKTVACLHYRQTHFQFDGLAVLNPKHEISGASKTAMIEAGATLLQTDDTNEIREFVTSRVAL